MFNMTLFFPLEKPTKYRYSLQLWNKLKELTLVAIYAKVMMEKQLF